ncbi:MAG: 6-phosphofructokinase [Anaerovoracaceae bacterium]|jgi:6-phosphofructokinase 1
MKRIAVLTSGGDSPGMNAAIRAVVRCAIYNDMEVYGIYRGFEGLIQGDFKRMEVHSVSDIIQRGGTMLRTARSEAFMTPPGFQRALDMLENFEIEGLVVIGGNGSMRGGRELAAAGVGVVYLPGTIDNDLGYTDFTIGFDTAINTVLYAVSNIRDTSSSHGRNTIIEVMGGKSGEIALYAGLAGGAEYILIPEIPFDLNGLCRKILEGKNRGKLHSIIIRAEGADVGDESLEKTILRRTGLETRSVALGHIQRGGSPTANDRILASRMGHYAVELLAQNKYNRALAMKGVAITDWDLNEALTVDRTVDSSLLKLLDTLSI